MKKMLLVLALLLTNLSPSSAAPIYAYPVVGCETIYGKYHHDYPATDIKAELGCAFVAPIGGVIQDVSRKDLWSGKTNLGQHRGGRSISLIGDDGVRYYGSHLSKVMKEIVPGLRVEVGQKLGEIGTSGSAKGTKPHLHFGISYPTDKGVWWIRRGVGLETKGKTSPWKYLQAWQVGKDLKPKVVMPTVIPAEPKK